MNCIKEQKEQRWWENKQWMLVDVNTLILFISVMNYLVLFRKFGTILNFTFKWIEYLGYFSSERCLISDCIPKNKSMLIYLFKPFYGWFIFSILAFGSIQTFVIISIAPFSNICWTILGHIFHRIVTAVDVVIYKVEGTAAFQQF